VKRNVEVRKSTTRFVLPALAVWLVAGAIVDSSAKDLPDGIPVGPWILEPTIEVSYEADTNVFRQQGDNAEEDRVATFGGELYATLPFRNSELKLGYGGNKESYDNANFPRDFTQEGEFELELNFKSGDTLTFRDVYKEDYARFRDQEGGLEFFEGQPYSSNRWDVKLTRDDPGRQGYYVQIQRQDFTYDGDEDVGFFDYRGFDNVFEYRQPLPNHRQWVLRYNSRRFNHYDSRCKLGLPDCLGGVGVAFRKELSDSFEFGMMGVLGESQPYVVRLGYSSFRYDGTASSDFNGLVGYAAWRIVLGGRTDLQLRLSRAALPSNFETYYISNAARAKLDREWLRFESGLEFVYYVNDYADPIMSGNELCRRRDSTYELNADWGWKVHERLEFEITAFHTNRRSTCDSSYIEATGLGTGLVLGW
jgi:hypothetical protein